jgi:hypothetical protein
LGFFPLRYAKQRWVQLEEDCLKIFQTRGAAFIAQKRAQNGTRTRQGAAVTEEELTIDVSELSVDTGRKGGGAAADAGSKAQRSPRSPFGSWGRKKTAEEDPAAAGDEKGGDGGEIEMEMVNPLHEPSPQNAPSNGPALATIHSQVQMTAGRTSPDPTNNDKVDI